MFYLIIVNKTHVTVTLGWHDSSNMSLQWKRIINNFVEHTGYTVKSRKFEVLLFRIIYIWNYDRHVYSLLVPEGEHPTGEVNFTENSSEA